MAASVFAVAAIAANLLVAPPTSPAVVTADPPRPAASVEATLVAPDVASTIPAPQIQGLVAAVELCDNAALQKALESGNDVAAIAAAGGGQAFRLAVSANTAPCVPLDDPTHSWVVIDKTNGLDPVDFTPEKIVDLTGVRSLDGSGLVPEAAAAMKNMAEAVKAEAGELAVASAFRSYQTQQDTYASVVDGYGQDYADKTSARAGFSEHQTGLAVDVVACTSGFCGTLEDLAASAQGQWLANNAWKYGWIIRYEQGQTATTGYDPEPWHLRYVGIDLATAYHNSGFHTLEDFFGLAPAPDYNK